MSQVQINHVFKSFGDKTVVDNISFEIAHGERFGLIGPNGAGKSTLIDMITGLQRMDAGSIVIDNLEVPKDITDIRAKIGFVPQEVALLPELNATDNLRYFAGLYGLSGSLLKERVQEALTAVGLTDTKNKKVKTFSGGMQRRLNIAAAVMHRPELLILDEPTVGVDPQSRNNIFEFILQMNQTYETTVIYTSHYMEEVESLCERIFILDQGKQVAYGSQDEIKMLVQDSIKWKLKVLVASPELKAEIESLAGVEQVLVDGTVYHLIVDSFGFKHHSLLQLIQAKGIDIVELSREEISLEEAFLQLTGKKLRD